MAVESDKMTTCATCGAVNRPGTRFCRHCGTSLVAPALGELEPDKVVPDAASAGEVVPDKVVPDKVVPDKVVSDKVVSDEVLLNEVVAGDPDPDVAASPVSATDLCPKCGKPLRAGARFCGGCGASTGELSPPGAGECPHCGVKLRAGARFCSRCGRVLASALPEASGRSNAAATADKVICATCGRPLRAGARFCAACRTPVVAPSPSPFSSPLLPEPAVVALDPPVEHNFIHRDVRGNILPLSEVGGRYVIMEKVAKGGMGAVYRATDKRLGGNTVAIKETDELMVPESERQKVIDLFKREAELLATLRHPNLVRVTDSFQIENHHYMAMEFIEGSTIQTLLDAALDPFPEERVLNWAVQLCDVLAYLHGQDPQVIYRDMKPANVMIVEDSDEVKLIDFGIARFHKPGKRRDTVQFGTDGYAPPEQYGKMQTDERSDVYALGAMLHQLLTLRDPQSELFNFPRLRRLNAQVSSQVADAIDKAVETNRDDRHQSVVAFRCALLGEAEPTEAAAASGGARFRSALLKQRDKVADKTAATGDVLDLGRVRRGAPHPVGTLTVPVPAAEKMKVSSNRSWLHVSSAVVDDTSPDVQLILYPSRMAMGRLKLRGGPVRWWVGLHTSVLVPASRKHTAEIACESPGTRLTSQVSVEILPSGFWVMVGWLITLLVLGLELGFVVAVWNNAYYLF